MHKFQSPNPSWLLLCFYIPVFRFDIGRWRDWHGRDCLWRCWWAWVDETTAFLSSSDDHRQVSRDGRRHTCEQVSDDEHSDDGRRHTCEQVSDDGRRHTCHEALSPCRCRPPCLLPSTDSAETCTWQPDSFITFNTSCIVYIIGSSCNYLVILCSVAVIVVRLRTIHCQLS